MLLFRCPNRILVTILSLSFNYLYVGRSYCQGGPGNKLQDSHLLSF